MKLKEIVNAITAFQKLSTADMKLQYAYRLQKAVAGFQAEVDFFNDRRKKLFEKYGKYVSDDTIEIPKEKQEEVNREMEELLNLEVMEDFKPIRIPIDEDINISANDVLFLQPFIIFTDNGEEVKNE